MPHVQCSQCLSAIGTTFRVFGKHLAPISRLRLARGLPFGSHSRLLAGLPISSWLSVAGRRLTISHRLLLRSRLLCVSGLLACRRLLFHHGLRLASLPGRIALLCSRRRLVGGPVLDRLRKQNHGDCQCVTQVLIARMITTHRTVVIEMNPACASSEV